MPGSNDNLPLTNMPSGKLYELAVFIYTLINKQTENIDIGREVKFADKWDDLVVKNNNGEYTFSQLKLVNQVDDANNFISSRVLLGEKQISLKKNDFDLKKYFRSYLRIKDQLKSRNQNNVIKKLIIFTNAHLDKIELEQEVGTIDTIKNGNFDNDIPNTNPTLESYKISSVKNAFVKKMLEIESDLEVLAKNLTYYAHGLGFNDQTITMENICNYQYYHNALVDEKVIMVWKESQRKNFGKFTQNFINGHGLPDRAYKLRSHVIRIYRAIQNTRMREDKIKDCMSRVRWEVHQDFGSRDSSDTIFLPNYEINAEDVDQFFNLLEFRVSQLNVRDTLDKIANVAIKEKFLEYYDSDPKLVEYLIGDFVQNTWKKQTNNFYFKETWVLNNDIKEFIEKLKTNLSRPKAEHKTREYLKYLQRITEKYDLRYKDSALIAQTDFEKVTIIITNNNILSSIKLAQYLEKEKLNFIFINLDSFSAQEEIITLIDAFKDQKFKFLILSFHSLSENVKNELFIKLSEIIRDNVKKIVFLSSAHGSLFENYNGYKEYMDKKLGLQYLKNVSTFLNQEISIQHQSLKLNNFINSKRDYKLIDERIIKKLVNNEKINIGMKPSGMAIVEAAYSEFESGEDINIETLIDKILIEESNDIILISGIGGNNKVVWLNSYLNKNLQNEQKSKLRNIENKIAVFNENDKEIFSYRILIVDDNFKETCFKNVCLNNSKRMIYWIKLRNQYDEPKFTLGHIYNPDFYVEGERICNKVLIDKSIKNQLTSSGLSDAYVIHVKNKKDFIAWLNLDDTAEIEDNIKNDKITLTDSPRIAEVVYKILIIQNSTVHWLKFENDQLFWCKTHGSINNLINFKNRNRIVQHKMKEDEFLTKIENIQNVIITADPGMGKSTTLIHLCSQYTLQSDEKETPWVILVNLKNHLQGLKGIDKNTDNKETSISKVLELLANVDNSLKDNFGQTVLKLALLKRKFFKPLIIAFDGFDEVLDESDRNKILSLLIFLKNKTTVKFLITTRLHYEKTLEDALSTFAVRLLPMDNLTQYKFIEKYLKAQLRLILSQKQFVVIFELRNIAKQCIDSFYSKIQTKLKDKPSWFFGTPLQLYLTLESCAADLKKWMKDGDQEPVFRYLHDSISEIYERFIETKYNIYYKKFNVHTKPLKLFHEKYLDECHRKIAKLYILKSHLYDSIKDSIDIVQSVGLTRYQDSNIEFIHSTFAEYYAADVCIQWLKKWKEEDSYHLINYQKQNIIMKKILLEEDYRVVRVFLNEKLLNQNIKYAKLKKDLYDPELLIIAFNEGTVGIVSFILDTFSIDINVEKIHDRNILFEAVNSQNFEIVKFLISKGDVHAKDDNGMTVLHFACEFYIVDIVEYLIAKGANVQARDNDDRTVLHYAAGGSSNVEIVELLIMKGADVFAKDKNGQTVLLSFLNSNDDDDDYDYDDDGITQLLIEAGASINEKSNPSLSALIRADEEDSPWNLILRIHKTGADVRIKTNYARKVCLLVIHMFRNGRISDFLIPGLHIDAKDSNGETILHAACKSGDLELARFLLELDADITVKNNDGKTPLDLAYEYSILDECILDEEQFSCTDDSSDSDSVEDCSTVSQSIGQADNFNEIEFYEEAVIVDQHY